MITQVYNMFNLELQGNSWISLPCISLYKLCTEYSTVMLTISAMAVSAQHQKILDDIGSCELGTDVWPPLYTMADTQGGISYQVFIGNFEQVR